MDKINQAIKVLAALDNAFMNFQYLLATKAVPSPDEPNKYFASCDGRAKPLITQDLALLTVQGMHVQIRDVFKLLSEYQAEGSSEMPTLDQKEAERTLLELRDQLETYIRNHPEPNLQPNPSEEPPETTQE